MELKGKIALVTGGGTGLGAVIVRNLASEGMHVAVHFGHSERDAQAAADEARAFGVSARSFRTDLSGTALPEAARSLIDQVTSDFGRLDLVVNNAGVTRAVPFSSLDDVTLDDWDQVMDVNAKAPFFIAQAAVPALRKGGTGQIINTASISGIRASGGSSIAYSVSKAATIHLTKCLATALAPDIRVNAVAPGIMRTRWLAHFDEAQIARVTAQTPLRRTVDLQDTAQAYVMLARNESITGQVIVVDGGISVA